MKNPLPNGLTLERLTAATPQEVCEATRTYCLRMIGEVYGYNYHPDWHADLDGLRDMAHSPYSETLRGAFYILKDPEGEIIASAGLRNLATRPDIIQMAGNRYPTPNEVVSNWRMYVDVRYRKQGLGRYLIDLRQQEAMNLGYKTVYFHCSAKAEGLRRYWEKIRFTCFAEDEETAHYDGLLQMNGKKEIIS